LRAALTCPKVTSEKGEKSSKAFIRLDRASAEPHETSFAKPVKKRLRKVNFRTVVCMLSAWQKPNISSLIVPRQSCVTYNITLRRLPLPIATPTEFTRRVHTVR
jgi:hypothetical protein